MIGIEWYTQWGAGSDNSKAEPWHTDLGRKYGNDVAGIANLGFMVDRKNPKPSVVPGTSFKAALEEIEKWFDFSETPCSIAINHSFDSDNRTLSGTLDITFEHGVAPGTYKVMFLLVEDSLIYKQYDYGMSGDWGHVVDFEKGYIPDFVHKHVVRDGIIVGDSIWGESFVTDPSAGQTVSVPFTYEVPTAYEFRGPGTFNYQTPYDPFTVRDEKVSLVAHVSNNNKSIVNAAYKGLLEGDVSVLSSSLINNSNSNLTVTQLEQRVIVTSNDLMKATLFSTNGRVLLEQSGNENIAMDITHLSNGIYIIRGETKSGYVSRTFIKHK